jgi:hypothetical protein
VASGRRGEHASDAVAGELVDRAFEAMLHTIGEDLEKSGP